MKIDKKSKRIDVILRVNLKDGGAEGINCYEKDIDPDPKFRVTETVCPWDNIPDTVLKKIGKPIIKQRTKTFEELEQLALHGLEEHWSRNYTRVVGNNVSINSQQFEVFVKAINVVDKSMDDVDLKYSTNLYWGRSNNSGDASTVKSIIANILEYVPYVPLNETIYYNNGYKDYNMSIETEVLRKDSDWRYIDDTAFYYCNNHNAPTEDKEFSFTSAHELGHTILKAIAEKSGGSTDYSYQHKGSSDYSDKLPVTKGGSMYPNTGGEIDLMKYYNNDPYRYDYDRIVAAENDVLELIWLTKIEIK